MSPAFREETDHEPSEDNGPARQLAAPGNFVTPRGLRLLKQRLRELFAARAKLVENDDIASRQRLHYLQRDLRDVEARIERAVVVDPDAQPADRVHFGAIIEARDEFGTILRFNIVGEDEADAPMGKISWLSPLATALLDARVGDVVVCRQSGADMKLEVLYIGKSESGSR